MLHYANSAVLDVPLQIGGFIRCAEFDYSPRHVIPAINAGCFLFEQGPVDDRYFVYWKPLQRDLSIFGVDWITFTLISVIQAVPGISAAELHATLAEQLDFDVPYESVKASLAQLSAISLVQTSGSLPSREVI